MKVPLRGWRAVLAYTQFDLRNLARNGSMAQFLLLPLALIPAFLVPLWDQFDPPVAPHAVVVTADVATAEAVTAGLADDAWNIDVVPASPPDLDQRLAAGDVQVAIVLDPDFSTNGQAELRTGRGTGVGVGASLHSAMIEGLLTQRVLARGGPAAEVQYASAPAAAAAPETGESAIEQTVRKLSTSSAPAHGLGLWAIGFFGVSLGANLGPALSRSVRERFNYVLAVGTPALDIYRSELLTTSITHGAQSMAWWAMYTMVALITGRWLGVEMPTQAMVLTGQPLLVMLAPAAIIQMTGLSMLVARAMEDAPSEVQRNLGFALMLPLFFVPSLSNGFALHTLAAGAALPVLGPVALWSYRISAATSAAAAPVPWQALLLVQLGWTALALRLGAWVFVLDETPLSWAKRRWRRA